MRLFRSRGDRAHRPDGSASPPTRGRASSAASIRPSSATGLAIATRLVLDHCGGAPSRVAEVGAPPAPPTPIVYDPAFCARLAGLDVTPERQRAILAGLGFAVAKDWQVAPPSWRRDIGGAADIVEEIVRIEGIDKLPSTPLPRAEGVARPTATAEQSLERRVRRAAAARGLDEAVTWSFVSIREAALFGEAPWVLANPISEEMKAMRPSLIPGLVAAARRNRARGIASVRLFEIGRRYLGEGERPTLGLLLVGDASTRDWRAGKARPADAFDAKADALAILAAAGAPVERLQLVGPGGSVYHPGRSGRLGLGPKAILAEFGALHPETLRALDLDGPAVAAEIFLDAIPHKRASGRARPPFAPHPLQPVTRDFAFLVPADLAADALLRAVRGADKTTIVDVALFDLFTGAGVAEGEKSLAVEVVLQPSERSFTEEELAAISAKVVAAAAKLGARLRG